MTVAALFVAKGGVYFGLPDVDPWDETRDARLYDGPYPVVAHPPCARWSRLAGFTEARWGYRRGDDGGCFAAALSAVRRWGGVIEHPAYSAAWDHFGLPEPTWRGGWNIGLDTGASCYVEQGRYGLPVKKATWLYACGVPELPELRWGYTPDGNGERPSGPWGGIDGWRDSWTTKASGGTSRTPEEFRDVLLSIARSADRGLSRTRHTGRTGGESMNATRTKRTFVIPAQIRKVNTAAAICAQANLRTQLGRAIEAGYTRADLQAELDRACRLSGLDAETPKDRSAP